MFFFDFRYIIGKKLRSDDITVGANEAKNVFRKDEIDIFEDNEALLKNAVSQELNMFKIPKVIS